MNRAERRREEREKLRRQQLERRAFFDEVVGAVTQQSVTIGSTIWNSAESGTGACPDCDAGLEMKKDKYGMFHMVVKHDDECPWYNQWLETKEQNRK